MNILTEERRGNCRCLCSRLPATAEPCHWARLRLPTHACALLNTSLDYTRTVSKYPILMQESSRMTFQSVTIAGIVHTLGINSPLKYPHHLNEIFRNPSQNSLSRGSELPPPLHLNEIFAGSTDAIEIRYTIVYSSI